jgi:heme-degrading monooxygenase HmoA
MHVSVGRLRLERGTNRLRLLWHGALAFLQAWRADGVIHASVYREDGRTLWSLSVWASSEAMLAYRNSGSHLRVMRVARALGVRVDFRHWQADAVPSWEAARLRLIERADAGAGAPANNGLHRTADPTAVK